MKTSNKFTSSRLFSAPFFFLIYNIPIWTGSVFLAKISAFLMIPFLAGFELTDYFDGFYARKKNEVSDFGKIFDPFADVILNLTIFACGFSSFSAQIGSYMPIVIFVFLIYREFSQSFIRMVAIKNGIAIAARKSGKLKTVFYIISGFLMIIIESAIRFGADLSRIADFSTLKNITVFFFFVSLLLSYISFIDYLKTFSSVLTRDKD